MLTNTQKAWAQAQVGKTRVAAVEGEISAATATEDDDSYILEVTGPDGRVELPITASAEVLSAMQRDGVTARLEGKVTSVVLDEENDRVGLEISGQDGSTIEWVVPEMNEEERDVQQETVVEIPVDPEVEILEFKRKVSSVIHSAEETATFKQRVLALISADEDVRTAVIEAVNNGPAPSPAIDSGGGS